MKQIIASLKDRAADFYNQPLFVRTTAEAVRSLTDEVNDPKSALNKHPEDYDLYNVGTFDNETGAIAPNEAGPTLIVRAQDLVHTNTEK